MCVFKSFFGADIHLHVSHINFIILKTSFFRHYLHLDFLILYLFIYPFLSPISHPVCILSWSSSPVSSFFSSSSSVKVSIIILSIFMSPSGRVGGIQEVCNIYLETYPSSGLFLIGLYFLTHFSSFFNPQWAFNFSSRSVPRYLSYSSGSSYAHQANQS